MRLNLQFPADLVSFTEKILNEKLPFLRNVWDLNLLAKKSTDAKFCS